MNVKFLNPFIEAACEVLQQEAGIILQRGSLSLESKEYITDDVTVIISLVGDVEGNVFYGMNQASALTVIGNMLGEPQAEFNQLAESGVAELGNVITGQASIKLAAAGVEATISPPTLLRGKSAVISTFDTLRLVVPLEFAQGKIVINLGLKESGQKYASAARIPVPNAPGIAP